MSSAQLCLIHPKARRNESCKSHPLSLASLFFRAGAECWSREQLARGSTRQTQRVAGRVQIARARCERPRTRDHRRRLESRSGTEGSVSLGLHADGEEAEQIYSEVQEFDCGEYAVWRGLRDLLQCGRVSPNPEHDLSLR